MKFNGEKNSLQHELTRAQDQLQLLSYENQSFKKQVLEQEQLIRGLKQVEIRCIESENQAAGLARELERCKDEVDKRNLLIESLKDKQYETEVQTGRQAKDAQEALKHRNLQIQDLENRIQSLSYEIDYLKQFKTKSQDQDDQIDNLVTQVQK